MIDEVVRATAAADLSAYVVWLPILPDDDASTAARAAARCAGPRVSQYWDPDRTLGEALGKALALPPREATREHGTAWDVYLLFGRGARWGEPPAFWMHQLQGIPAAMAPRLDVAAFRRKADEITAQGGR